VKYAFEMGPGSMIYIPNFINIGSAINIFGGKAYTQTHRRQGDRISFIFFSKYGNRLKTVILNSTLTMRTPKKVIIIK
jgi:hypothetical protein